MRLYFPDTPDLPLPPGHRFPAAKYRLLRDRILSDRRLAAHTLIPSPAATRDQLLTAHDAAYVDAMFAGRPDAVTSLRLGLPWSGVLLARSLATVGGALASARAALQDGLAGQLAGGTHHAHRDHGSGFCVFNDLAVTALVLLAERAVSHIAILDLDVHQGDGTAAILADEPRVLTVSIHGAKNYPFAKVPSKLDIGLPDATGDRDYLSALETALDAVTAFAPDLMLYIAGADVLAADRLGRLSLTPDGLALRDARVLDYARARGLATAFAMGGGYAEPISLTVDAYASTVRTACLTAQQSVGSRPVSLA